ncbi:carotenoid-cleaving dioxygenase, mitochondrial-like [Glandiceps talaboti]
MSKDDQTVSVPKSTVLRAELFHSVETEYPDPLETTVSGQVPHWLRGCLLRNGPGRFEFGDEKYNHYFDGSALLHRFHIQDGAVAYHRRFFSYFTGPDITDNCCVNWFQAGEDFFVCTETNIIHKVDRETLESKEKVDYTNYIAVNSATAHPHQLGDYLYNIGNTYGSWTKYSIIKMTLNDQCKKNKGPIESAKVICTVPSRYRSAPSYYHSFAITDNYIIFLEQPLYLSLWKILTAKIRGIPIIDAMTFDRDEYTRFHVIRRETGELLQTQYTSDAFFNFHVVNAYEDDHQLVIDVCAYTDAQILVEGKLSTVRDPLNESFSGAEFRRLVIPLPNCNTVTNIGQNLVTLDYTSSTAIAQSDGRIHITCESLFEDLPGFELPRINYEKYNGKMYRYVYGFLQGTFQLAKLDLEEKTYKIWGEKHYAASEPVFVPSPDASDEDDGVVISCMCSFRRDKWPYLVILDAKSFKEIARAEVPTYIPFGLHHIFASNKPAALNEAEATSRTT